MPETGPAPFLPYFFGEEEPPSLEEAPLLPERKPPAAAASPMLQMAAAGWTTFGLGDSSSSDDEEGGGRRVAGDGGFSFGATPRAPQSEGGSSSSSGEEGGAGGGSGFGSAPSPPTSQSNDRDIALGGSGSAAEGVFRTYDNPAAATVEENVTVGDRRNEGLCGSQPLPLTAPTTFSALPAMQQYGQQYGQQVAPFTPHADGVAHIIRDSRQSSPMGSAAGDCGGAIAKQQLGSVHASSELFSDDALGRQVMTSPRPGSSWLRAGENPAATAPAALSAGDTATPVAQRPAATSWGGVTPSAGPKPSQSVWREEGRRSAGERTPTWALDRPGSIGERSSGGGGGADESSPLVGGAAAQPVAASVWGRRSGGGGADDALPEDGGVAQPVVAHLPMAASVWSSLGMGSVLPQTAAEVPQLASVASVPEPNDMSTPGNAPPGGAPRLDVSCGSSGGMEALQQEGLLLALGLDQEEADEEGEGEAEQPGPGSGRVTEDQREPEWSPVPPAAQEDAAAGSRLMDLPPLAFTSAEEEEEAAGIQEAQLPSPAAWFPPPLLPLPSGVALQETQQVGLWECSREPRCMTHGMQF